MNASLATEGEGDSEVAVFSAKRWVHKSNKALIESMTPCHEAQVVVLYRVSNPVRLTVPAAKSVDYITASQHLMESQIPYCNE